MHITTTTANILHTETDCLLIPINRSLKLDTLAKQIDKASHGQLSEALALGDFSGKIGAVLLLPHVKGLAAKRLMIIGCGDKSTMSAHHFRRMLTHAHNHLLKTKAKYAMSLLHQVKVEDHDKLWALKECCLNLFDRYYQFDEYKSTKPHPRPLIECSFALRGNTTKAKQIIKEACFIAEGIKYTKDLANTPPNICNPLFLAKEAVRLTKEYPSIDVEIIDEKAAEKMGMGAFVAVAKGSDTPGQMIVLQYHGGKKTDQPIALVGKGITFDTGGYSIKPAIGMQDMKFDMCGAATVMGILKTCAAMKLKINMVGVVAAAENMISGKASRLSDVMKTLSGKTVEMTNTDAEGRLVLCDALTYVARYQPKKVISIATLTGAAIISFGYEITALLSNYQPLANALLKAGQESEDLAWQLPLREEYHEYLKSSVADLVNAPASRVAGTITAAAFLSNFTEDFEWAHLDIAGSSLIMEKQAKASGRPVPLLMQYLLNAVKR